MQRLYIVVKGRVQGVGFRPFIYRLANKYNLKGWVKNSSQGVLIDIEGDKNLIKAFLEDLEKEKPQISSIEEIILEERGPNNYHSFEIKESVEEVSKVTFIPPDIALCNKCLKDIKDPRNRRYKYPFTNCTNCGPRFSIIKKIPYDRNSTTMKKFKMCGSCEIEYKNPVSRRFHAEPNACKVCGPKLLVTDSEGKIINNIDPIEFTKEKLKEGAIFAIKGIGGFHLVCDAKDKRAIKNLRDRKRRPYKPLAVMFRDIYTAKKYCYINKIEEEILTGDKKPIVILNKIIGEKISEEIAPNQKTLGVMFPYTPVHELLFDKELEVLVMTSGNISSMPIEYKNENAINNLKHIVDYFLLNNRDIYISIDDSIVKVVENQTMVLRSGRGYVPIPYKRVGNREILALGSNMKNTFCISKEGYLYLSQHNGDIENLESYDNYGKNLEHFKNIFSFNPKFLAYDSHPTYMVNRYIDLYDIPKIKVQHHHAHIASCMGENKIEGKVIGVAFDGTGYGLDGNLWGGEFMICDLDNFTRAAHMKYRVMPGGEMAIKEPWRMGVSYIYSAYKELKDEGEGLNIIRSLYGDKGEFIVDLIKANINCHKTSSMGRLFDAIASIIEINHISTYEGQAACELEALIKFTNSESYSFKIAKNENYIIDMDEIILGILQDKSKGLKANVISQKFHNTVVKITVDMCILLRSEYKLNRVMLSGGVFQNGYILSNIIKELKVCDFEVHSNKLIPINDEGISFGEIMIANSIINKKEQGEINA
ncbi:carbamoyltransferase HypF [Clostridium sp. 'White wine YQ']|uniref:carbamoyltransferase HypF n=1 Tax=Clostridium sp. 'White wine YQ' TaxID=3027474 RepID=UPI002365C181|nr:carbamoyltransferase HypF [Clostridium sp. 'White wine YQ']MDD7793550.1 carbamoyltransferase HypF [Clostridium sp. 'White wine YQ']